MTNAPDPREAVARRLHRMLAPAGEDAEADWVGMNRWRRAMYFAEADKVIALVRGEASPMDELIDALRGSDVKLRFWVCPVREHRSRKDGPGWPVVTVEWRGDVAHCTAPGCGRTSADKEAADA